MCLVFVLRTASLAKQIQTARTHRVDIWVFWEHQRSTEQIWVSNCKSSAVHSFLKMNKPQYPQTDAQSLCWPCYSLSAYPLMVCKRNLQSFSQTAEMKEHLAPSVEERGWQKKGQGRGVKTPQIPSIKEGPTSMPGTFGTRICTTVRECWH